MSKLICACLSGCACLFILSLDIIELPKLIICIASCLVTLKNVAQLP
jgi:hypothetical protein